MRARCMALCVLLGACGPPTQTSGSYSFEGSLQGWTPAALDVAPADPAGGWSIIASTDQSYAGVWSARVFLDNETDAGMVWIVRSWRLDDLRRYGMRFEIGQLITAA